MAWIPKYKVDAGLYGGYLCPPSPINSLINLCSYKEILIDAGRATGERFDSDPDYSPWVGSGFSMSGSVLENYIRNNADNETHEFVLAELVVANPTGAQFYKQSLTIYAKVLANEQVFPDSSDDHDDCYAIYYELFFTKICRREYPTPYSAWSETILVDNGPGFNGYLYKRGKKEVPGWLIYWTDDLKVAMGNFIIDNTECFGMVFYKYQTRADDYNKGWGAAVFGVKLDKLNEVFIDFDPDEQEDPNDEDEEEGEGPGGSGGTGDHILPNYPINIPPLPDIGIASISWLTVYEMSLTQVNSFGQAMLDVHGWDALKQWFNNPLEAIVNIMLIPAAAPTAGSRTPVVGQGSAAYSWPEAYPIIHEEFCEVPCGQIEIPPYWDSAFDFDSYTKFMLFLPFIGYKPIKADDIMGGRVGVTYHVNVCTGDCIAFVYRTSPPEDPGYYGPVPSQVIAQFNGNCGIRVPIGRSSSDAAIDASMRLMGGALGVGMIALAGGVGLADPAEIGASQLGAQISTATMTAVNANKQTIERAGSLGGGIGYMGILKPYIIREIPRQVLTQPDKTRYHKLEGYPANIGATLYDVRGTGYQAVEAIQLDGLAAYDSEISEIETYLRGGVIV